jgi:alpha-beta hydrolase superfamily lysophospholipase
MISRSRNNINMAVRQRIFTYRDADGIEIFVRSWIPDVPSAVIQIAHGIGEHSGRYVRFAENLAAAGFAVYADDHRGHGKTGLKQWQGDLSKLGYLGKGGLRATEAALVQLAGMIRDRHPSLRFGLFAHSWGSLMAQRILQDHPSVWDAVVLSGTAYRSLRHMESGQLNKLWQHEGASGFEWLSSDTSVGEHFLEDELNFYANIPKLFGIRDALRLFGKPRAGLNPRVPILITSGEDDPINKGKGLQKLASAYRAAGVRDVSLKTYPHMRHELLNESIHVAVTQSIITWFTERLTDADVTSQ